VFEIGTAELQVMGCLVHADTPETVISETGIAQKVVLDIFKYLHHYRYIKVVDEYGKSKAMFEADGLIQTHFILTAKGLSEIAKQDKKGTP
jgi:hypothetical protein